MRSRRTHPEHQEAISRRLALLSAELTPAALLTAAAATSPELAEHPSASPNVSSGSVPRLPGRHAARRRTTRPLRGSLPPARFVASLGPGTFAAAAILVSLGLLATAWWAIQSRPQELSVTPVLSAPTADPVPLVEPAHGPAEQAEELVVDVAGKVRRPGIAILAPGARVVDALEAAGGARRGVDLGLLNLARPVVDGEQILVGLPQPTGAAAAAAAAPSGAAPAPGGLVNINTAGQAELETLPGVGPVTAQAILTWRTEHDGFAAIEELLDVQGIGEATLAQLAPHVTV